MTTKVSTGLRTSVLGTGSVKSRLAGGFLDFYNGTLPATADAALSGNVKLCRVSLNATATGLTFDTAVAGVLSKTAAETWSGAALVTGTPTFYRFVKTGDDGTLSTTQERLQGSVGIASTDIVLEASSFTETGLVTVSAFTVTLPTL